jgi:hypothetical protein
MISTRCVLAGARIALAVSVFETLSLAQSGPAPSATVSLADSLQGPARQAYDSAKLLAANHDFVGALTEFRHSYELSKDPRLLFNMAICEKELRHYGRMEALLGQYLSEGNAALISPENRATALEAMNAARPLVATLRVSVNEAGATVTVDGEPVGKTPLATPVRVDLGRHTIAVKKDGFDSVEQAIEAPGGSDTPVTITLAAPKHAAQLVIVAEAEATVAVDEQVVGKGRFDGTIPAGTHEVRVTLAGKLPYQTQIELHTGETRTMEVTLEGEHKRPIWPWIAGGAALAAGAVVGGYFLFKPEDHGTPLMGQLATVQANAFWGR